ncbi:EF-hand domain-containing family member B-like [Rhynchophorus ferrugineus]|uniref:EF-hand domain-containing family member B-like n=1 Tax=Rhynchophorus ferrugineus TaxID=354439 RepID=UPI003FCDDA75
MAGNSGKFIDRSPIICAAGKSSGDPNERVSLALKQYKLVDEVDALKHQEQIWQENVFIPPRKLPNILQPDFKGTNTEISEILRPPVKTRYQQLICDLKDTPYSTYWNTELGKSRDPIPGLPMGMNALETTFGIPTLKDITVKELVNPSKGPYQVLRESQVGHEMYKKTHNNYNPSERIDRGYFQPPYDPNKCYGEKTKYDPRGIWVKCACDWFKKEPLVHGLKIQADYLNRSRSQLGKVLAPNNNISCVEEGHAFGKRLNDDLFGVEGLLKDPGVNPCMFKRDFYKWFSSLNKLRWSIKEKQKKYGFSLEELYKKIRYLDKEKTGWLPVSKFLDLCSCHNLNFLSNDIEALCKHLKYIDNDNICYRKFIDLIDIYKEYTEDIKHIDDLPPEKKYYTSTYQAANCDYLFINNAEMPPAGIPSIRHDLSKPVKPHGGCRADLENLGNETSAKAVVNPNIYTNFGLTYRDFFLPRQPATIRKLFEKIGYTFPGNNFERLWGMGVELDQTGLVCIDTFKNLLRNHCPELRIKVDEKDIECGKLHM